MKSIIITIFVCAFIVVTGFQAIGEEWTAEQKDVWEWVELYWGSIEKGDAENHVKGYHDKSLDLFSDNPSPYSKSQVKAKYKEWLDSPFKPSSYKLKPIAINIIENVANVFYLYSWSSEAMDYTSKGRTMITLVNLNNKWVFTGGISASCDKPVPCPYKW